jgi:hypothetical protein
MPNLLTEAGYVGLGLIPISGATCYVVDALTGMKPHEGWAIKAFIAGSSFHMLSQFYGLNNWFLTESVAAHQRDRATTDRMSMRRRERYAYQNYAVPEFPDADRRYPMNDPWAQGSWTHSPVGMNSKDSLSFL